MKLIIWQCKYISYKDKRRSTKPIGIQEVIKPKNTQRFTNVLAIFSCVIRGDKQADIEKAIGYVVSHMEKLRCQRHVVIVPFAHLDRNIASPKKAVSILEKFANELRSLGIRVSEVSFGYHKDFELQFMGSGNPLSVAFRDTREN